MNIPGALEAEIVQLYAEHAASLKRHAAVIIQCDDLAGDAVQETFMRYFAQRSFGRVIENPRAWLYQVLRNYLFDRMSETPTPVEGGDASLRGIADPSSGPEEQVCQSEMAGIIAASLSVRERECLGLRSEGFTYGEIAGIMGLKIGTVGALLVRAHNKIRSAAAHSEDGERQLAGAVHRLLRGPARNLQP
jgi:RNA polymerase sigma-70 factor (ECF subfamily)